MSEFDTDTLVDAIRNRGGLPETDSRYTDDILLALATTEMRDFIAPMLYAARAEHGIYEYSTSVAAGTASYRMPQRALGGSLRDVIWTPSSGTTDPFPLIPKPSSDPYVVRAAGKQAPPTCYFVRNYSVVMVPTPDQAGTLSTPYYARPNRLVSLESGNVGTIFLIDPPEANTTAFTIEFPSEEVANLFIAQAAGISGTTPLDFVRGTPGFESLGTEFALDIGSPQSPTTVQCIVQNSVYTEVPVIGDYLCIVGTAPVPQIPVELHGLLAARVALLAVEGTGDNTSTLVGLRRQCDELKDRALAWLSPRVESGNMSAGGSLGGHPMLGVTSGGW